MTPSHHEKPICATCGCDNVTQDAMATWDVELQEWKVIGVYDGAYCEHCDGEVKLKWVPVENKPKE